MNDEQILRKLAEIEGKSEASIHPDQIVEFAWNPLESWSDCGPLVEKHQLNIGPNIRKIDDKYSECWDVRDTGGDNEVFNRDLKRAICMAIIESRADEKAA